jgi:K+-sensing histidine kinase KdpD
MSTTSTKKGFVVPAFPRDCREAGGYGASDGGAAHREPPLLAMLSLAGWRKRVLETFVFLAVITVLQRSLFGVAEIPGLPHPYWLPVLLASCQYGVSGGMFATVAASVMYLFGLSPPSAAQDFYAYAGMVAVQPAVWLATALVLGGLRNLHIHQSTELADQLAACHRRACDLSGGLERATAEINALERRIAVDMRSVAALSRSFSLIDMSDRRAAAVSYGELFRVGTGTATFTVYLKDPDGYVPVWAVEEDTTRSTKSMEPLPSTTIEAMMTENARRGATGDVGESEPGTGCYVVRVPPSDVGSEPLAVIVCDLHPSQDARQFRRRADELSRAFATILYACPGPPLGARS